MADPIRQPWVRVLAVVLMGIGGLQVLAYIGLLTFTAPDAGLWPEAGVALLLTVVPSLGLIWLGWVLWTGDESFGASLQPATRRFVGNGMIAAGLLMVVLAGGCALLLGGGMVLGALSSATMADAILGSLGMLGMVVTGSGPFVALGLGLWVLGRQLKYPGEKQTEPL